MRLEVELESNGEEILVFALEFKFAGAVDRGADEFNRSEANSSAAAEIGDESFLIDAVTVLEGIAIEENVVADDAAIRSRKRVNGPFGRIVGGMSGEAFHR